MQSNPGLDKKPYPGLDLRLNALAPFVSKERTSRTTPDFKPQTHQLGILGIPCPCPRAWKAEREYSRSSIKVQSRRLCLAHARHIHSFSHSKEWKAFRCSAWWAAEWYGREWSLYKISAESLIRPRQSRTLPLRTIPLKESEYSKHLEICQYSL